MLKTYTQCAQHLRKVFECPDWQEKHKVGSSFVINEVQVFEAASNDIFRDENEVYDSVEGIRKSFGYLAVGTGRVLQRWFDCWCCACMQANGPGDGMDGAAAESGYQVLGCERHEPWWDNSVQLQGARGVKYRQQLASKKGRELVQSLKPGTFVAVEDRNGHWSESPFLIGVTVACNGDSCISKEYAERETHEGTRYDPGDCAVAIRYRVV